MFRSRLEVFYLIATLRNRNERRKKSRQRRRKNIVIIIIFFSSFLYFDVVCGFNVIERRTDEKLLPLLLLEMAEFLCIAFGSLKISMYFFFVLISVYLVFVIAIEYINTFMCMYRNMEHMLSSYHSSMIPKWLEIKQITLNQMFRFACLARKPRTQWNSMK